MSSIPPKVDAPIAKGEITPAEAAIPTPKSTGQPEAEIPKPAAATEQTTASPQLISNAQAEAATPKNGDPGKPKPEIQETVPTAKPVEVLPRKWQDRLLPLMAGLLIGLTVFFFIASFVQLAYLHWSILRFPAVNIYPPSGETLIVTAQTFDEKLAASRLDILARLEAYLVQRRYHQASVALMSGLWVRYLGFVTGMILALVGASFVLGKLREPITELASKMMGYDLSLKSASPGIILVVLGVILMFATIINRDLYEVQDMPVYLYGERLPSTDPLSQPGSLPPLDESETPSPVPTEQPTLLGP